jgi:Zn-dependent metalloprotease
MPTEQSTGNGLTTLSIHASDESSSGAVEQLQEERPPYPGLAPQGGERESVLDSETAARRYLEQALSSQAVPSLTAPVANGVTSEFKTLGTETIPLTKTRTVKFRQMVNGIPVYGSLVTVEIDDDKNLVGIDTALGEPDGVDPVATVSPADALTAAAAAPDGYEPKLKGVVPRLNYYFDAAQSRWRLVYILEDVPVTLDRTAEPLSDRESQLEPPRFIDYVVDAHDGHVVVLLPRTPSMAAPKKQTAAAKKQTAAGKKPTAAANKRTAAAKKQTAAANKRTAAGKKETAADSFGVKRTFLVSEEGGSLVLKDPVHNVETFDFGFGDPAVHADRLPGDGIAKPPAYPPGAVSAHANAVAVSDFLRTVLMRDNIDGSGGVMQSTINCVVAQNSPGPKQWHNAFWDGQQMVYGQVLRGNELRSLSANVDVVAHEMFHGITDHTSRLEYAFQPGALNESYSDIFGTIVANLGNDDPRSWDWLLGEDLLVGDKPFRDLSDPTRFGQPAHMNQFRVLPNTRAGDWGGVHINSGIHNKAAFNMLTTEDEDATLILSPDEVAAVFYLALTQRLSRTSQFADSRRHVVASARTLFRTLPADQQRRKVEAVDAAFAAVGIP